MSNHTEKVQLFIDLYTNQPELFSSCKDEVKTLIEEFNNSPSTAEKKRQEFLRSHPEIDKAYKAELNKPEGTKGIAGSRSQTPSGERSQASDDARNNSIQSNPGIANSTGNSGIDGVGH